jgi:hypothetical protein
VENNTIIKEHYGKSSDGDFIAKGHCKALFRGPENLNKNEVNPIKAKLQKTIIRVFDIHLYDQIEITEVILIENWEQELSNCSDLPQFEVKIEKEAIVRFSKIEWENVDFIRTEIVRGILINPQIIYAYQESGYTFGEIEGELIFEVYNPKVMPQLMPLKTAEVIDSSVGHTAVEASYGEGLKPLARLLPDNLANTDASLWRNTGCIWPILRFFALLLLAFLLFKGCSHFSSTVWDRDKENRIKNDSTLQIPDGDEKVLKDGKKKFIIDSDTTLVIPPGFYKLFIRDHGSKVDHDRVNILLNGQVYKRNMEIYRKPTEIPLTNLKYGENFVDFAVMNQGDSGNCTAEIIFVNTIDSTFTAKIKINNVLNHISRLKLIQR